MLALVSVQQTENIEPIPTQIAYIWFLLRVKGHVSGQTAFLFESFLTQRAAVRSFLGVSQHVFGQSTLPDERSGTLFALKEFLGCVNQGVSSQCFFSTKRARTLGTGERLLPPVSRQVRLQGRHVFKSNPTLRAEKHFLLFMTLHVFSQTIVFKEFFPTLGAFEGFLSSVTS